MNGSFATSGFFSPLSLARSRFDFSGDMTNNVGTLHLIFFLVDQIWLFDVVVVVVFLIIINAEIRF